MNEKLSALMDGELGEFETRRLLTEMERDPQLRAAWERYHLARAVLRNEPGAITPADFPARVAARLDEAPLTNGRTMSRWRGVAATAALAASIAAVAILGAQLFLASPPAPVTPMASVPTPSTATVAVNGQNPATRQDANAPDAERTLNTYLVEHNEFAPAGGVGGLLPYVRVVGTDSGR